MCDSPELLRLLKHIEARLDRRVFTDVSCSVSDTQSTLVLDYQGYHYLYFFSPTAITLNLNEIGLLTVPANTWTNVSFRPGTRVFSSGQASPVLALLRATDEQMPNTNTVTVNQGTNPWIVSVSNVNGNGQKTMANSSPVVLPSDQVAQGALGDATANPTTLELGSFLQVFNGTTWDRARGDSILPGIAVGEDVIRYYSLLGKSFSATTGKNAAPAGTNNVGASVFMASATNKALLVYSAIITYAVALAGEQASAVTVDPALSGLTFTAVNTKGGGAASVASVTAQNTNITLSGNAFAFSACAANQFTEMFPAGGYFVPAGVAGGVLISIPSSGANNWTLTIRWLEI